MQRRPVFSLGFSRYRRICLNVQTMEQRMAQTMKAAVVHHFGKPLAIEQVEMPKVTPGQILVKVAASGVCHTDLHAADGDWPVKPKLPFIPGHEAVGHVAAVGTGVKHVKEGDPRGCAVAAYRVWSLRTLHHRVGNAV
jgi:hypothetical protein